MSRSVWRTNAAIVGGVVAVFLVAASVTSAVVLKYRQHHESERVNASYPQQGAAAQNAKVFCARFPEKDQVECAKDYVEAEKADTRAKYDLQAQQEMAEWALGMFLISGFGLLFSAFGLAALVWTFREQRKLTHNQSRAYLEIIDAFLRADGIDITTGQAHYRVDLHIRNNGETPALGVRLELKMTYTPEWDVDTVDKVETSEYELGGLGRAEIPAKGVYSVVASGEGNDIVGPSAGNKSWRYQHPHITVSGRVIFHDIFSNEERELPVSASADIDGSFGFDPPVKLYGSHNWRVKDSDDVGKK